MRVFGSLDQMLSKHPVLARARIAATASMSTRRMTFSPVHEQPGDREALSPNVRNVARWDLPFIFPILKSAGHPFSWSCLGSVSVVSRRSLRKIFPEVAIKPVRPPDMFAGLAKILEVRGLWCFTGQCRNR